MAKYTTELRTICETYAGCTEQQGLNKVDDVISKALPKLFDFDFPMYDESYRSVLETKIVKHFYTREICAETVGRWKLFLNERLNLIMPYYNQRYKSTLIEFNPMYDVDLTTDHNKDNGGNSESSSNGTSNTENNRTYGRTDKYERNLAENSNNSTNRNDWEYYSDTPQGGIDGLENNNYLTNATHNADADTSNTTSSQTGNDSRSINDTDDTSIQSTGSNNGKSNYTDTESYLEHVKGKTAGASFSKMLTEYRNTFINIDNEIINQLNDLFINLW